jgi:hypothetical protein
MDTPRIRLLQGFDLGWAFYVESHVLKQVPCELHIEVEGAAFVLACSLLLIPSPESKPHLNNIWQAPFGALAPA